VIALCGLLCRAETFNDLEDFGNAKQDWFKTFLELPKWDSFPRNFHSCFQRFRPERIPGGVLELTQSLRQAVPHEIVAMDGKALRRALTADKNPKYIVSAWAEENGLVLGQLKVDEKSNEITAVPQLLRVLELRGCIVTLDAMGCQKNIAIEIKEADAEYVLSLEGNQDTLHREVKEFLDDAVAESKTWRPAGAQPEVQVPPLASRGERPRAIGNTRIFSNCGVGLVGGSLEVGAAANCRDDPGHARDQW